MSTPRSNGGDDILIVDDTPANLRLLSQMLTQRGHRVRAVTSGPRALASVQMSLPNLILLDIKMPEMNGYELCELLKADVRSRDVPVIFISALDELQDKVRAFAVGGVDYITKPFQAEEVIARVETHLTLRRLQERLEGANQKMARELALAGQVQASFLPSKLPSIPGWDLAVTLKPARETSGDFYDVHLMPDGKLVLLVADVVDKGVGAALYMALSWALIRAYSAEYPAQPELVMEAVNRRILTDTSGDQFLSAFYGVVDPGIGSLTYCNAGHYPPYILERGNSRTTRSLPRTGMLLGVEQEEKWSQASVQLAPGDVLVLYTDGILDAEDAGGGFFGRERLLSTLWANLNRSAQEIQEALLEAVADFSRGAVQSDDIALVVAVREIGTPSRVLSGGGWLPKPGT
jgi:serine phosphatase RsbU (regulator of sigma subunit)